MLADSLGVRLAMCFPFNLGQFLPILSPASPVLVTYDLRVFYAVPSYLLPKNLRCFSRYLFLCSLCFRFISINYMRGSFFTLSSSTSVLSGCVLSSFTVSSKVPSLWTFKKLVRLSKPSLLFSSLLFSSLLFSSLLFSSLLLFLFSSLLFCHLENGLKLRVKPRFTCWGSYTKKIAKDDGKNG